MLISIISVISLCPTPNLPGTSRTPDATNGNELWRIHWMSVKWRSVKVAWILCTPMMWKLHMGGRHQADTLNLYGLAWVQLIEFVSDYVYSETLWWKMRPPVGRWLSWHGQGGGWDACWTPGPGETGRSRSLFELRHFVVLASTSWQRWNGSRDPLTAH